MLSDDLITAIRPLPAVPAVPAGDGFGRLGPEANQSLFMHMRNGMAYCRMFFENGQPVDFIYLATNPAFEAQTGLKNVVGKWVSDVIPGIRATDPDLFARYGRVAQGGGSESFETYVEALRSWFAVSVYSPHPDHFVAVFDVITGRKKADERLRMMATVFSASNEAIVICDADNHIVTVNPAFSKLTGYLPEDVIGKDPKILSAGLTSRDIFDQMWQSIKTNDAWQGELWDRRKSGGVYPKWLSITVVRDDAGKVVQYIGSFVDIAERKASEERARHLAHYDALTNLPNRFSLNERLAEALGYAKRDGRQLAVLMIDLDNFKGINDTLGHQAGDQLLIQVARRLRESVRESDILVRVGGDEFVVVLPDISSPAVAAHVAGKLIAVIAEPFLIDGTEQRTSPCIGICLYPDDATESSDLLRKADVAMYHAKSHGRSTYHFFTEEMHSAAVRRVAIESELRAGLEQGQFVLHYQPQMDLSTRRLVGVEALVRWQHPIRGLVSPLEFIPVAEETGLITPLGDWVLGEACRQLGDWRRRGITHIRVSVNLSADQFMDPGLPKRIEDILKQSGLGPESLDLEVTESMSMRSPADTIAMMKALTAQGLSLSMDDFGTGYSSLAYLKLFPISTLKIDRSFVKDIETDTSDAEICEMTVLLAHKLGMTVVAEGVETTAQLKYLAGIGCEKIQGYLVSKPLQADQAECLIRDDIPMSKLGSIDVLTAP